MLTMLAATFTMQMKLAFSWKLSEASLTFAGANFAGWAPETGKAKWWVDAALRWMAGAGAGVVGPMVADAGNTH